MKKLLILQNRIENYRKAVYEELNKKFDVTVLHTGKRVNSTFKEVILKTYNLGPFIFLKKINQSIKKIDPDYIISMFDLHWPQFYLGLPLKPKKVFWGLDEGKNYLINWFKKNIINLLGNNVLFYSKSIQSNWSKKLTVKSFVAQNSVKVTKPIFSKKRKNYINVGSLHYRKRNDILLFAFTKLPKNIKKNSKVLLVGKGPDIIRLKKICKDLNIEKNVEFFGHINKLSRLQTLYGSAISSISVGQAGLAVSQSLGYGVPFITNKNAITGGEIFSINNKINGYLLNSDIQNTKCIKELSDKMLMMWKNRNIKSNYIKRRKYYDKNLSLKKMVNSIINSLNK